jgi:hypothetical protein
MLRIGAILYGFCGGYFGRDCYEDKRIEAIGVDWVVARTLNTNEAVFAACDPERLIEYTTEP